MNRAAQPQSSPQAAVANEESFTFGGRAITFRPGQTVAAALMAAGEVMLRRAENGAARGALCCIGVCWECRCLIDGRPNTRACMTLAEPGMIVELQEGLG